MQRACRSGRVRPAARASACAAGRIAWSQRGSKAQPGGGASGLDTWPRIANSRVGLGCAAAGAPCRAGRRAGPACRDARARRTAAAPARSRRRGRRTSRPRRRRWCATTPRLCVMNRMLMPVSACSLRISSRICAWIVTSSAVVGSSAISSVGSQAIASAIITRWRMPPESWCGYSCRRCARGRDLDQLEHAQRMRAAPPRGPAPCAGARSRRSARRR